VRVALAVRPVPPSVELMLPLTLFLVPAVVPVTSTLTVQFEPAVRDPELKLSVVLPAAGVKLPPVQFVLALGVAATCTPDGRLSLKAMPVRVVVVFGLVIVNVNVDTPPVQIVEAVNDLLIVGGATTVIMAVLLVAPVPLSFELMAPVVLLHTPAVVPVTVTMNEQLPLAARVPPLKLIRFGDVVETMPPQVAVGPEVGTVSPAGNVSVKPIPVNPSAELGLVIENVRVVVPPSGMLDAPNAFMSVGAAATFIVTVAVLVQPPGLFSTYLKVSIPVKPDAGV